MVVCHILMHPFKVFGAPTIECPKGINVHKLATTKDHPSFWFYGESIWICDRENT